MAEDIELPGMGKVDEKWVWVGGALVVGIVGYAWLSRGSSSGDEATDIYAENPGSAPDYVPPTTGNSNVDVDTRREGDITTNAEWTRYARDELVAGGELPGVVTSALGKFLARQSLTPAEADIVRQALGIAGQPPSGGPWNVIVDTVTPPGELAAPTLSATAGTTSITWSWNVVPGAVRYIVEREAGGRILSSQETTAIVHTWAGLTPAHHYGIRVYAVSDQGTRGARARLVVKTASAPSAPKPKPGPAPAGTGRPAWVRAAGGRGFADLSWAAVPGATGYEIARMTATTRTPWVAVGKRTSYRAPTQVPQATTFAWAVRAAGPGGYGAPQHSNNATVRP